MVLVSWNVTVRDTDDLTARVTCTISGAGAGEIGASVAVLTNQRQSLSAVFPEGISTVTCSAVNADGAPSSNYCSFRVTVAGRPLTRYSASILVSHLCCSRVSDCAETPPTISCSGNQFFGVPQPNNVVYGSWNVTVSDPDDSWALLTCTITGPASGGFRSVPVATNQLLTFNGTFYQGISVVNCTTINSDGTASANYCSLTLQFGKLSVFVVPHMTVSACSLLCALQRMFFSGFVYSVQRRLFVGRKL